MFVQAAVCFVLFVIRGFFPCFAAVPLKVDHNFLLLLGFQDEKKKLLNYHTHTHTPQFILNVNGLFIYICCNHMSHAFTFFFKLLFIIIYEYVI